MKIILVTCLSFLLMLLSHAAFALSMQKQQDSVAIRHSVVAGHLDVPWDIAWGPDNRIWFTEQSGTVSSVNPETGEQRLLLRIVPDVYRHRTLGLLCMALHPDMQKSPFVFLNYIFQKGAELRSRWVRYTYDGSRLIDPITLLEIPADVGHNGSRIVFAPDGKIFLATGDADVKNDAANSGNAQDLKSLSGKILRLNIDGTIPPDNPYANSPVWATGFRVPQGLVYGSNGKLYSAEHGNQINDEVNLVVKAGNYGYPNVLGHCDQPAEDKFCKEHQVKEPLKAWTPTVAPAGMEYYNHISIPQWKNSLLVATLKDQSLRVLQLNESGDSILSENVYFQKEFGRLRDVCVSPSGDVFIATSNRDWNPAPGFPVENDDRIIRLSAETKSLPSKIAANGSQESLKPASRQTKTNNVAGQSLYESYCASCHKADGTGVPGTFPPLRGSARISGDKSSLIRVVLDGLRGPLTVNGVKYDMEMPGFSFLSDAEVAELVQYVRSTFGKRNESVSDDEVRRIRSSLTGK